MSMLLTQLKSASTLFQFQHFLMFRENLRITTMTVKSMSWMPQKSRNLLSVKNDKKKTPFVSDDVFHAYHLYIIQVEDRLGLYNYLREQGIYAQVHYVPLHLMPYYAQRGNKKGDFPVVEDYYEHCLSLPIYPTLTDEEQS